MGRTIPSITLQFQQELASLSQYRRALRRSDQLVFDELFASAQLHLAEAAYVANALPLEIFLVSMLLEERKALNRLRTEVEELRGRMERNHSA